MYATGTHCASYLSNLNAERSLVTREERLVVSKDLRESAAAFCIKRKFQSGRLLIETYFHWRHDGCAFLRIELAKKKEKPLFK